VFQSLGTWSGDLIQSCVLPLQIHLADTNIDIIHVLCTLFQRSTCLSYIHFSTCVQNIINSWDLSLNLVTTLLSSEVDCPHIKSFL
jgi:hypothetical protein